MIQEGKLRRYAFRVVAGFSRGWEGTGGAYKALSDLQEDMWASVSITDGSRRATAWQEKKVGFKHEDKRRTWAINDKVVVFVFADFLL